MRHLLDNPAWHAFIGPQREFGRIGVLAACYHPKFWPFGTGAEQSDAALAKLASLAERAETIALTGDVKKDQFELVSV